MLTSNWRKLAVEKAVVLYSEGKTVSEIAAQFQFPTRTVYRWVK